MEKIILRRIVVNRESSRFMVRWIQPSCTKAMTLKQKLKWIINEPSLFYEVDDDYDDNDETTLFRYKCASCVTPRRHRC